MAQCYGRRRLAARACALACLLAALYCSPALAASWTVEGRVVGVSDGDTITLLDDNKTQYKVRFAGIDAPEKGQAFGMRRRRAYPASSSISASRRDAKSETATPGRSVSDARRD